jgi:indole-3-glycerol phosphate synthase
MAVGTMLGKIIDAKRRRLEVSRAAMPEAMLAARAGDVPAPRDFARALERAADQARPNVIAEFKRASPSAGVIRKNADPPAIASEYEAAGAAAISVLTEEDFFDGALAHLTAVRARVGVPVLREDFVVDPWQLLEARAAGADAVLLIVAALTDAELAALLLRTYDLGMAALVEIHDDAEAERAVAAGARIIGVNHRNLATLEMDMGLFARIRPRLPAGTITVAESGLRTLADVRRMAEAGADAILVGEALMRQPSPGAALAELLQSERT